MIRGDGVSLLACLDDVTNAINTEDNISINKISIKGEINFDVSLAWKVDAS